MASEIKLKNVDREMIALSRKPIDFAVQNGFIDDKGRLVSHFEVTNAGGQRADYCGRLETRDHHVKIFAGSVKMGGKEANSVIYILSEKEPPFSFEVKINFPGEEINGGFGLVWGEKRHKFTFGPDRMQVLLDFIREDILSGKLADKARWRSWDEVLLYLRSRLG